MVFCFPCHYIIYSYWKDTKSYMTIKCSKNCPNTFIWRPCLCHWQKSIFTQLHCLSELFWRLQEKTGHLGSCLHLVLSLMSEVKWMLFWISLLIDDFQKWSIPNQVDKVSVATGFSQAALFGTGGDYPSTTRYRQKCHSLFMLWAEAIGGLGGSWHQGPPTSNWLLVQQVWRLTVLYWSYQVGFWWKAVQQSFFFQNCPIT